MIYAPTLAILTMGNLDHKWFWPIVLITGLSNTFYTVVSGVRGVIVTEAVHIPVIILGITATIVAAWWQLPVPFDTALDDLVSTGRLNVFDFSLDPAAPLTFWTVVFGVSIGNLTNYLGDQMSLQRYLVTGDARAASRSFAVNIIGVVIVVSLLIARRVVPERVLFALERPDIAGPGGRGVSALCGNSATGRCRWIVARRPPCLDRASQWHQYPGFRSNAGFSRPFPHRNDPGTAGLVGAILLDRHRPPGHGGRRIYFETRHAL